MATPGRSELARHGSSVSQLANDIRGRAERLGRDDLSRLITAEAEQWAETTTSIALLGAPSVGKSSLVAALTGRQDLPIGHPTQAPVIVRSGRVDRASWCDTDGQLHDAVFAVALATASRAQYVDLTIDAPRMIDGLTLIDCPAFGSVGDPRGNQSYVVSRRADHLIITVDLGAPLSRLEVELAQRCADRFGAITLVGTHIDRIRGWRRVLADSADTLRGHLPETIVDSFGVSPVLADAAFDPELDDDEALELLGDSGMGALQAHLATLADRRRHVRLANFTALLDNIADELARDGRVVVQTAIAGTESDVNRLAEIRQELMEARDDRQSWFAVLSDTVTAARDETAHDVIRMISLVAARSEARINEWSGDTAPLIAELDEDLRAEAAAIAARIADRIDHVVDVIVDITDASDLGLHIDRSALAASLSEFADAPVQTHAGPAGDASIRMRATGGLVGMATSTTMMMTAMSGVGGAAAMMRIGAFGAAALFSGVSTAVTVKSGRRQRDRQDARAAVKTRLDQARSASQPVLRAFFLGIQRSIEAHLKHLVRERITILERELAELQTTAKADAIERRRRATSLEDELRQLDELRRRTAQLAESLRAEGSS